MIKLAGGAFLTSREVFTNPIWQNIVEFRLFFLIYGNAIFSEEGHKVDDTLTLTRGQWLRSTRKLQEDLQYIDNRKVKQYSTATINRAIQRLVKLQRVCTKTHELGTVFTVLNYEQYQGFEGYSKKPIETGSETVAKQSRNNNKKDNKEKKDSTLNHKGLFQSYTSNPNLLSALMDFYEMRIKIKKPLISQRAFTMLFNKLNELAPNDEMKIAIIEQSIFNSWQGVFALKDDFKPQKYNRPLSRQEQTMQLLQQRMQDDERVNANDGQTSDPAIGSLFDSLPYYGD